LFIRVFSLRFFLFKPKNRNSKTILTDTEKEKRKKKDCSDLFELIIMAFHLKLIKEISSKNSLNDIRLAYDKQERRKAANLPVDSRVEYQYEITDIRKCTMAAGRLKFDIFRVFIRAVDSGDMVNVGWVIDNTCSYCLTCCKELKFSKHHCRTCGDRTCGKCGVDWKIEGTLENLGILWICNQCYGKKPAEVSVLFLRLFFTYVFLFLSKSLCL
jgi:hypothetical protein